MKSNKFAKKLLSLIIVSTMIVSMLPISALAAESDVMIEDQAEAIVEEAADVTGEVVEEAAEVPDIEEREESVVVNESVDENEDADSEELTGSTEILSVKAEGITSGSNMSFNAQLTGLSVSAVVPVKRVAKGSYMTADIVDVSAYEDAIAKKNYGKSVAGLYGLELHFYDKKGKEIKHINTSNITVTVDGFEASSYFIGRIDNKVNKIQRGTEPTFTFTEKKAYTYVIAGLEDDGLVRASGEADGDGNKRFNLNDENVNIEVVAPEDAFADGVAMEASDVTNGAAEDGEDVLVGASADEIIAAYNISFYNEDGAEQQPSKAVTVTINTPLDMTKGYELIHIADDGTRSSVEGAEFTENGVTFTADSFSVYAVIEGSEGPADDQPYRTTYEFYNGDGTEYYFKDAAGRDQYTQILKNGEILEDVGIPTKGASQNAKFVGWYVWNSDGTLGEKVEVGQAQAVTSNTTIRLKAKMQGIVNVFFVTAVMKNDQGQDMARSIVTVKQVEYTVGQTDAITVNTSDVTTEAPTSEQAVVGWNRDGDAANAGTVEGTDGVITLYANGSVSPIKDVMMYPAIQNAYWLYFDENDGGTGGGASYTAPQFVTVDGKPTRPADPHRTGYTFGGWYKDAACTQAFDFNEVMTATTTVYAKWNGASTTYTIIVKVQSTSDSAKITSSSNLVHNAKTYDFWKAYTITNVQTGGTATVSNTYKQLANQIDSSGYITYETCDPDTTIAGDGSTVLYVYYQRQVMTITWRRSTSSSGSISETWYGLYGASFEESGKTYLDPGAGYLWRSRSMVLTFKDSFMDFNPAGTTLNLYLTSVYESAYQVYFYTENLDGTWKLDQQFDFSPYNYDSFTFNEKYSAFSVYQYSRNGTSWNTATVGQRVNHNNQSLYIRYSRNTYDIEYHNGAFGTEGTVVRTDSVKYDASLSTHTNPTVTYPVAADADHYDFIGWFADSSWKTMVTFTELDDETKNNYRNWYGIVEFVVYKNMPSHNFPLYAGYSLKGWDCALDPNGGEFTNPSQAGVFWLQYGQTFSSDIKTNISREGYIFQGWMVANVEGDLDVVTKNNLRYVGNDSNWTMTEEPWEFSTGIVGPTYLMAKWFYKTSMSVVYDANGGSDAPTDDGAYSDHATTVAFRAPVPPDGKNFIGWDIQGTNEEEKLQPGATFEVSSDYAVDGVVTLKAVYHTFNPEEEVPVSHLTWYANGGENTNLTGATDDIVNEDVTLTNINLQLNTDIDIPSADTFKREGYKFIGWAKQDEPQGAFDGKTNTVDETKYSRVDNLSVWLKLNDDGESYTEYDGDNPISGHDAIKKVAVDELQPYEALYAVWERTYFYIFHSSTGDLEAVPMPLSEEDTVDLTDHVEKGSLYGGYYSGYGVYSVTDNNKKDAKAAEALKINVTSNTYDGKSLKYGSVRYWTKTEANTASGMSLTPHTEEVYYLKEVPGLYLGTNAKWTYDRAKNNEIQNIYLLSVIDDTYYTEAGFVVTTVDKKGKIVSQFSYSKDKSDGTVTTIKADNLIGQRGYLAVVEGKTYISDLNSGNTVIVEPYWKTLDSVKIKTAGYTFSKTGEETLTKDNLVYKAN